MDTEGKPGRTSPLTKGMGKVKKNKSQMSFVKGMIFYLLFHRKEKQIPRVE